VAAARSMCCRGRFAASAWFRVALLGAPSAGYAGRRPRARPRRRPANALFPACLQRGVAAGLRRPQPVRRRPRFRCPTGRTLGQRARAGLLGAARGTDRRALDGPRAPGVPPGEAGGGRFLLNNQLTDFGFAAEQDGRPVANRVQGGKRRRSSTSPTSVFDRITGNLLMATGSAGGPAIIHHRPSIARHGVGLDTAGSSPIRPTSVRSTGLPALTGGAYTG
jgi:hypothetical protein